MSGKILIEWKHRLCGELSRQRYMDSDITRTVHIEIANIFFNQEQDDSDEISSEHNSAGKWANENMNVKYILLSIELHSYEMTIVECKNHFIYDTFRYRFFSLLLVHFNKIVNCYVHLL